MSVLPCGFNFSRNLKRMSAGVLCRSGKAIVYTAQTIKCRTTWRHNLTCLGLCALRLLFWQLSLPSSFLKPCACSFAPLLPGIGTGLANIPWCLILLATVSS